MLLNEGNGALLVNGLLKLPEPPKYDVEVDDPVWGLEYNLEVPAPIPAKDEPVPFSI